MLGHARVESSLASFGLCLATAHLDQVRPCGPRSRMGAPIRHSSRMRTTTSFNASSASVPSGPRGRRTAQERLHAAIRSRRFVPSYEAIYWNPLLVLAEATLGSGRPLRAHRGSARRSSPHHRLRTSFFGLVFDPRPAKRAQGRSVLNSS
jgi:hypothetical protein